MQSELWAIVEVMGHAQYAGRVSEFTGLGVPLVRVEVPAVGEQPAFEKLLGSSSIFRITPVSEEVARKAAEGLRVRPLSMVTLPSVEPAKLRGPDTPKWIDQGDVAEDYDYGDWRHG